jgi:hypothetical protein
MGMTINCAFFHDSSFDWCSPRLEWIILPQAPSHLHLRTRELGSSLGIKTRPGGKYHCRRPPSCASRAARGGVRDGARGGARGGTRGGGREGRDRISRRTRMPLPPPGLIICFSSSFSVSFYRKTALLLRYIYEAEPSAKRLGPPPFTPRR